MKFLRWIGGIVILLCLVTAIFKAGSNLINIVLVLSTVILILDLLFQWKKTM